ncbi:hypothetical protein [Streptomyces sp. A012304]|uniref:hypothetical protein n=1 Tax=Streptomyces sp. A012304 TaxID=375446 RepID=UPI00222E4334|nr:hypothetical protein [Streptomyces sp. A012304]GKQ37445.1 hypothetical protein ALMP_39820 [Streptomyces sp. A012304]
MFRGTTVRTVVSILAAVLLALPFFTPASPFAHAHTNRHTQAKDQPGIKPSGTSARDESVTSSACDRSRGPLDPLRTRDRLRAGTTADSASQESERAPLAQDRAATRRHTGPAAPYHRPSRSSADRSPAALQVFRC